MQRRFSGSDKLWLVADCLILASLVTINAPPYLVFNPSGAVRWSMGIGAFAIGIVAALAGLQKPKDNPA